MSGVVKTVAKVFKKITRSTIGKVILGTAVTFLTGGLGGAVLSGLGASAGFMSSTLGTVLSYGISGAAAGAITAGLTGADPLKGALIGGVGGAVVGGASKLLGIGPAATKPAEQAAKASEKVTETGVLAQESALKEGFQQTLKPTSAWDAAGGMAAANTNATTNAATNIATNAAVKAATNASTQQAARSGLLGWLQNNKEIVGHTIAGAATGGLQYLGDRAVAKQVEGRLNLQRDIWRQEMASHSGRGGLLTPRGDVPTPEWAVSPQQKFDFSHGRWMWDPYQRRMVYVPTQPTA